MKEKNNNPQGGITTPDQEGERCGLPSGAPTADDNSPKNERFTSRRDKCIPKQEGNTLGSADTWNLSDKIVKNTSNSEGYVYERYVKEFIRRQNVIRDKIFKEMEEPIKDQIDFISFKVWLITKFDELDKLVGENLK